MLTNIQLINDMSLYVESTVRYMAVVEAMNQDPPKYKEIFDTLILARDNMEGHMFEYYKYMNQMFKENTAAANAIAYNMSTNPVLERAEELRTQINTAISHDQYKAIRELWQQGLREYCDTKQKGCGHNDYDTRIKFLDAYHKYKANNLTKVFDLRISTNPSVLAQWAQTRAGINNS